MYQYCALVTATITDVLQQHSILYDVLYNIHELVRSGRVRTHSSSALCFGNTNIIDFWRLSTFAINCAILKPVDSYNINALCRRAVPFHQQIHPKRFDHS